MFLYNMPYLEERGSHLDAQRLCLVTSRHSTAVIVGEHNDWFSLKIGSKNPLTGSEEIIAVGKGKHIYIILTGLTSS